MNMQSCRAIALWENSRCFHHKAEKNSRGHPLRRMEDKEKRQKRRKEKAIRNERKEDRIRLSGMRQHLSSKLSNATCASSFFFAPIHTLSFGARNLWQKEAQLLLWSS